ncbi:concanavalin A-like lectin/glucanase domain-containing protein [Apiospora phragmitis]|uniref:Concanavalin A-like lectin/glucanase domain-containing protein n=1 Tax=Apiospora phragmitis TaxID=2905665 RepID=A0ABR1UJ94_9PEZI
MRPTAPSVLAACLAVAAGSAEAAQNFLVDSLSFGYSGRINPQGQQSVPGFSLQGQPNTPEILSNKVILTQPSPGNARGAVWGDNPNQYTQWVADVDFRANGPERGSGNFNIWLVRRGAQDVGSASIYTVNRFEGLALVVDRYGGGAGMIRGFLNDGITDYRTQPSVDSLAFGHCDYSYRNLGRPSQIKLRQSRNSFKVEIDGRLCFETDKVSLPTGYNFGLTAASADNPDSFEVFKMVVMTENLGAQGEAPPAQQNQGQQQEQVVVNRGGYNSEKNMPRGSGNGNEPFDDSPDSITSTKAQFADLHNRIQSINHHLSTIFRTVASHGTIGETRHEETSKSIHDVKMLLAKLDRLDGLQNQLSTFERDMNNFRNDISRKISDSEANIKRLLGDSHGTMLEHVAVQTTPRHGTLIFVIIGTQIMLVAAYILYERKKTSPKKYL